MKQKLNTYFTAATSYDGDLHGQYLKILSLIKNSDLNLLSGEQTVNQNLLSRDKKLSQRQIFDRERRYIDLSDFIIAEVSKPSLGVGSEITYALAKNKPVLTLVFEGFEDKISPIIAGNPAENLFLEYYNFDKLPLVIRDFIKHVNTTLAKKGKLIVIEGGDGSGKTVQTALLLEYLKKQRIQVKHLDFPQYYHSFHGKTVAKFLRGEFGKIDQVSPYLASLAYALDRLSVKEETENFLLKGGYIIANRYATTNIAYQAAKFTQTKDREEFIKWVYQLEYTVNRIPKENIVIYLAVPWKLGIKLTAKKGARKYLSGNIKDIHEIDTQFRQKVEKMYLELAKRYKHWVIVNCLENKKLLNPQQIHKKVVAVLQSKKILI